MSLACSVPAQLCPVAQQPLSTTRQQMTVASFRSRFIYQNRWTARRPHFVASARKQLSRAIQQRTSTALCVILFKGHCYCVHLCPTLPAHPSATVFAIVMPLPASGYATHLPPGKGCSSGSDQPAVSFKVQLTLMVLDSLEPRKQNLRNRPVGRQLLREEGGQEACQQV